MSRGSEATASRARSIINGAIDINILLAFVFGVVFLAVMLGFAIGFPNPAPFQIKVFVTALALAAAGVGAVLPGSLNIKYKNTVRASGALALFAIVWFSQPALEQNVVTLRAPTESPEPVVAAFLQSLDDGDTAASYAALDPVAVDAMVPTQQGWQRLYDANIRPLGRTESRMQMGVSSVTSPPGHPVGIYRTYSYLGAYSAIGGCREQAVTVRATQAKDWRVYSYVISPITIPCMPAGK